jgi:proteasome lid subunit RPN8/RPN11
LIGGTIEGDKRSIQKVYLLTNIDQSNEHFSMDPKEQLAAVKDMRANGLKLLGNFHSHPESPSRPSEEDKRLAYDSKVNYLILSLMDLENPVFNAFRIDEEKNVTKEELVIE